MVVALPELAALAALLACAFLVMLYYAYGYSIGAVMQLLVSMFRNLSFNLWLVGNVGLGFIGDAIDGLDHAIRRAIGTGISETLSGWHYFLHVSAYSLTTMAHIIDSAFHDTYGALKTLREVTIPALLAAALAPLLRRLDWLEQQVAELPHNARVIINQPLKVIEQRLAAVASAAIAVPLPRIGSLERELSALRDRLRSLERGGVVAAVGVVAGVMLSKLGLGWTRCSNVGKVARRLCGLDSLLLDALLIGTTAIVSSISLVEWAELMLEVEDELVAGITHGFRELRDVQAA